MKIIRLVTRANLLIAFVIVVILFLLYGNKTMINDWAGIIGIQWIWVPLLIILFAAILYGRYCFRNKKK